MKKEIYGLLLLVAMAMLFTYCSREEDVLPEDESATLSFGAVLNDLISDKSALKQALDIPACSDAPPAFVEVVLSGTEAIGSMEAPLVLAVNPNAGDYDEDGEEEYFTEESAELELEPGTYTLEFFAVYDGDPSLAESNLIWAAPRDDGGLALFVDTPLPMDLVLGAGVKKYVDVEVLCFDDRLVNEYGYLFFDLEDIEAVEFCAFANYCDANGRHFTANYTLSLWEGTDGTGEPFFSDSPVTGTNEQGDFFAEPLCLAIPVPEAGTAADAAYLYYEIVLEDWEANYGDVEAQTISGTLSWDEVTENFLGEDAIEYQHFRFGCEEEPVEPGDDDGDGVNDDTDNCPNAANPDQADTDDDGIGDACEEAEAPDGDEDGVNDEEDNCPEMANADQADADADGIGDVCEEAEAPDGDEDGISDDDDNCPEMANADQADADADGIGDVCDEAEEPDGDEDGISDDDDNCPEMANADQADADGDGIGDICDEADAPDGDGDGVADDDDNCPEMANADQADADGDGEGDACESTQTPGEGGELTNGANHMGDISEPGEQNIWTFSGDAGDYVTLRMNRMEPYTRDFGPWIRLISPNGEVVSNSAGLEVAEVNTTLPVSGTYTVLVASGRVSNITNITGTGSYVLRLAKVPGAFVVPSGDEGGELSNGSNHSGEIPQGDVDIWTFTANEGDFVTLRMNESEENSSAFGPWIRLISPTGEVVSSVAGLEVAEVVPTITTSGTYTVLLASGRVVNISSIRGSGSYVVQLTKVP